MISGTGAPNGAVCPDAVAFLGPPANGPCMMFQFTLADTATLSFTMDWKGTATNPDVDIYACSDSTVANFGDACQEEGAGGATTAAKPEKTGFFKYPAGTHYVVIDVAKGTGSKNYYTTIRRP
jgi:hypothetical protein